MGLILTKAPIGMLLCLSSAALAALAVAGLQRLTRGSRGHWAERALRMTLFALIGTALGEGLPLLWPFLQPWRFAVLGASIGLAWAATRPWGAWRDTQVRA